MVPKNAPEGIRTAFSKNSVFLQKKKKSSTFYWTLLRCRTRIRTSTDRTKTCSATITPWDNQSLVRVSLSNAMQSYDFLLNCPNVFAIIFQLFSKSLTINKIKDQEKLILGLIRVSNGNFSISFFEYNILSIRYILSCYS